MGVRVSVYKGETPNSEFRPMGLMWASVSALGDMLQCAEPTIPEFSAL